MSESKFKVTHGKNFNVLFHRLKDREDLKICKSVSFFTPIAFAQDVCIFLLPMKQEL